MQRYLVAINYDGPHDRLAAEVRALALGDDAQFHVVVPAVARGSADSEGQQLALARRLLDSIESALDDVPGIDGDVGDAKFFAAIVDELNRRPHDVLVIATPVIGEHERERLVNHVVRLYGLPVISLMIPGSEWLQRHPLRFGLDLDQEGAQRGAVTLARGRRRRSRRTLGFLAIACCVLLATTVGAIAWGASRSSASVAPFPSVTATESDFTIRLSASHVAAGPFALIATNRGPSPHELVVFRTSLAPNKLPLGSDGNIIEDSPLLVKVADSGTNVAPGQSRTLYTVLTPGTYVFVCNLPGHYRLGMRAALVVQ
jgi:Sulfocyanin (SoxE) domain